MQLAGNKRRMTAARSSVSFGPHISGMIVKDKRYQVQLLTPQPNMRGAIVDVTGESLEFACATGEPCQVLKTDADKEPVMHRAVVFSDKVVKGGESFCMQLQNGKKPEFVARSSVLFGAHVAGMVDAAPLPPLTCFQQQHPNHRRCRKNLSRHLQLY